MFAVTLTVLKTQHFAEIVATPHFSSPTWPFLLRFAHAHFTPAHPHGFSWARHCSVNCNKKVNIKNASATTLKQIGKDEKWLQDWLTADPAPNRGGARL